MALDGGSDRGAGDAATTIGEEQTTRIGHTEQTGLGHLEQAQLIGGTEAVLHGAHEAQRVMTVALEGEHGVDDVLEHTRASETALLGDMTDEHHGEPAGLRRGDETGRALAHLGHRTGGRTQLGGEHGLDRVDDQQRGIDLVDRVEDVRQRGVGGQPQVGLQRAEPLGPKTHLLLRLLGRDVEHLGAGGRHRSGGLQQQRGLADTGLTTDEGDRTGHEAAAEHSVELVDTGGHGLPLVGVDLDDRGGAVARPQRPSGIDGGGVLELLDQGVPGIARGASPDPLGRGGTTVGAAEHGSELRHHRHPRQRVRQRSARDDAAPDGAASFDWVVEEWVSR